MSDRFSDDARQAMDLARKAAADLGHSYIGTEHVLLGLVAVETSTAVTILAGLGISSARIRTEIEGIVPPGSSGAHGQLPSTPRCIEALRLASEEAAAAASDTIGTGHLLLGLLREEDGIAARVLSRVGVDAGQVREQLAPTSRAGERVAAASGSPGWLAKWLTHWSFWPAYAILVSVIVLLVRPWEHWVRGADDPLHAILVHDDHSAFADGHRSVGTVMVTMAAAGSPGEGWLRCDGSRLLRAEWPALSELLPDETGSDPASFTLPNYEGLWSVPWRGFATTLNAGKPEPADWGIEHLRFWIRARQ